jgi:hypothetical protein
MYIHCRENQPNRRVAKTKIDHGRGEKLNRNADVAFLETLQYLELETFF